MVEGPLVNVVLLGLLVVLFGIQQRSRPQLYFRYWLAGWILVFCSFLAWKVNFATPLYARIGHEAKLEFLLIGGLAFLLSFVVRADLGLRTALRGLMVAGPASALFFIADGPNPRPWLLCGLIVALHLGYLRLAALLVPRQWVRRRLGLGVVTLAFGSMMLAAVYIQRQHELEQWVLAQVFTSVAILYAGTGKKGSLDRIVGTMAFLAWGLLYPVAFLLQHEPAILKLLLELWDIPKYAVGFAMTLRIFEGSRSDVARLADGYRVLYEDFRLLYENHPLAMWIYDPGTSLFLSSNAAASTSYGYAPEEFLRMSVEQIIQKPSAERSPDAQLEEGKLEDETALEPDSGAVHRVRHRRKDGSTLAVELTEHEILFQGREARFVLAVDVTAQDKLNQELLDRAQHDAMTGLPNRMLLEDRIEQCLMRSVRDNKKAVLFTMDADRFKLINDTYGHLVGDEALKAIANRLKSRIRSVDTIARTGGEEFTAIIGGLNQAEDAGTIATMLVRLFEEPLPLPGQDLKVTISVGGAIYPDDASDAETLRKRSDQALYHAKRMGRNRFAMASREVCASFDRATAIELAVREGLRSDGFSLCFQPIYNNEGVASHFEVLLRMKEESAQAYPPSLFIPVAEECGLIVQLGNWVLEEACRTVSEWRGQGLDRLSVAINVSGKQILQKEYSELLIEMLRKYDLPTSALQLELTETSLMSEPVLIRESMTELARLGIRFAIDDFGSGYSSLARLADLPISLLKIDQSFTAQLGLTQRGDGIVAAIIHMAQTLEVQVAAEGVESEEQLNLLQRRGCDLFQGYLLSQPMSSEDVVLQLKSMSRALLQHPAFEQTRSAASMRLRKPATSIQLPALVASGEGSL